MKNQRPKWNRPKLKPTPALNNEPFLRLAVQTLDFTGLRCKI